MFLDNSGIFAALYINGLESQLGAVQFILKVGFQSIACQFLGMYTSGAAHCAVEVNNINPVSRASRVV
jgi:hypothetical protein